MFPLPERKARPVSETVRLEVSVPLASYWKEAVAQQSSTWMHFFNTEFPLELKADSNFHVRVDSQGWRKRRWTASLNEPVSELVAKCSRNGEGFRRVLLEPGPSPSAESESGRPANDNALAGSHHANVGRIVSVQEATVGPSLEVAAVSGPKSAAVVRREAPAVHSQGALVVPEQKLLVNTSGETPAVPRQEAPAVPRREDPAVSRHEAPAVPRQEAPAVPRQEAPAVPRQKAPAVPRQKAPAVGPSSGQKPSPSGPNQNPTVEGPSCGEMLVPRSSQRGWRTGASRRGIKGRAILNLVVMDDSIVECAQAEFATSKRTLERDGSETYPMLYKLLSDLLDH